MIDVRGGNLHQFDSDRVASRCVIGDARSERAKITWRRLRSPLDDCVRVIGKILKQRPQQRRPWDAAVASPHHPAQRLNAEPGAASFIENRQSPPTDTVGVAIHPSPSDRPGTCDNHAAITFAMGADASRLSVSDDQCFAEWVPSLLRRGQIAGLAGASQGETGHHLLKAGFGQVGTSETLDCSIRNRCKTQIEPKTQVRRAGYSVAERLPRER